jgi:multiple antibiotic resistance protein
MIETAGVALATFFATIGPLDISAFFAALTVGQSPRARLVMAARGTLIATIILLTFALSGEFLLDALGISLAALRTAGGILLLLIGIEMVSARTSGATSATEDETREAETRRDISVFPLATPLIAGPGAISASILLMAHAEGDTSRQLIVCLSLLTVLLFTFACLLAASQLHKILGRTGTHVINRVFGVLLAALAVQFIFDGIAESGLIR